MDPSLKVKTDALTTLKATAGAAAPGQQNCLMQVAHTHRLETSEKNYEKNQRNTTMHMLRKEAGLAAPIIMNMELAAARKIGRLPFLESSHVMEDTLLGRDELLDFSDILGGPDSQSDNINPHLVLENYLTKY